jgi:hypothetical protein
MENAIQNTSSTHYVKLLTKMFALNVLLEHFLIVLGNAKQLATYVQHGIHKENVFLVTGDIL